jgi:hypothetical protein
MPPSVPEPTIGQLIVRHAQNFIWDSVAFLAMKQTPNPPPEKILVAKPKDR